MLPVGPRVRAPQYVADREPRSSSVVKEYQRQPVVVRERTVASSVFTYYATPKRAKVPPRYRLRSLWSAYANYRKPRRAKVTCSYCLAVP